MKKEFNLSEKRKELSNYGLEDTESLGGAAKFYEESDVKEFIRRLKEEMRHNVIECELNGVPIVLKCVKTLNREIDKLAGGKLI